MKDGIEMQLLAGTKSPQAATLHLREPVELFFVTLKGYFKDKKEAADVLTRLSDRTGLPKDHFDILSITDYSGLHEQFAVPYSDKSS